MSLHIDPALFADGCKIVVALSGGADSVALTHWLRFSTKCRVFACHLNHSLRGEESLRDERFVRSVCEEWGIPLLAERADVSSYAAEHHCGLEEAGRILRYALYERALSAFDAEWLATAHTATDNIETMLLWLCRGTGLHGLCGIPPRRDRIIRPLLSASRQEVEAYCATHQLLYMTDSTNAVSEYSRNLLRLEALPALRKLNPQLEQATSRTVAILREEDGYLAEMAAQSLAACREEDGLSCERLAALPTAIRRRTLAAFCAEYGVSTSFEGLAGLERLLLCGRGSISLPGGCFAAERGLLSVQTELPPYYKLPLTLGETTLPDGRRILAEQLLGINLPQKVYKNLLYLYLDYDKIEGEIYVRQRLPGDSIRIAGRGGRKTLKKFLNEQKLSTRQKALLPVFADAQGVIAVWGCGPDERVMLTEQTQTVLRLSLLPVAEFPKKGIIIG